MASAPNIGHVLSVRITFASGRFLRISWALVKDGVRIVLHCLSISIWSGVIPSLNHSSSQTLLPTIKLSSEHIITSGFSADLLKPIIVIALEDSAKFGKYGAIFLNHSLEPGVLGKI